MYRTLRLTEAVLRTEVRLRPKRLRQPKERLRARETELWVWLCKSRDPLPWHLCRPRRLGDALLALRVGGYRVPVQGQRRSAGFHLVCCLDLVLLAGTERVSNRAGGRHLHYAGLYGEEEPGGAGLLLLQAGAHRPHRRGHGGVQQLALSVSSSTNATSRSISIHGGPFAETRSCVTHLGS